MTDSSLVPSNAATLPWNTPDPVTQAPVVQQPQVQAPVVQTQQPVVQPNVPVVQQPQTGTVAQQTTPETPAVPQAILDELASLRAAKSRVEELEAQAAQERATRERNELEYRANQELVQRNVVANSTIQAAYDHAEARADWEQPAKRQYLATVVRNLLDERDVHWKGRMAQLEGQIEQQRMATIIERYPRFLVNKFNLDPSYEEVLRKIEDPNTMGIAAELQSQYGDQLSGLRGQIEELTAATMASQLQNNGVFNSGGQGAPAQAQLPASGSARELRAALADALYG